MMSGRWGGGGGGGGGFNQSVSVVVQKVILFGLHGVTVTR